MGGNDMSHKLDERLATSEPDLLMMAAHNSSLPPCLMASDMQDVVAWHMGERGRGLIGDDMIGIGAEVGELFPMIARSLSRNLMYLADDCDDVESLEECQIASALLRRMTPEIDLLASLPDSLKASRQRGSDGLSGHGHDAQTQASR